VSEAREINGGRGRPSPTIEKFERARGADIVNDPKELAVDIWESYEELDELLADLRASRDAPLA
jgi:hypothetical protein